MADIEALFLAHQSRLYRYLCRAVGHADTARDLTQDVFLRVTRGSVPVAGDDEQRAWLFRIARNLALDHHRHQRHVRAHEAAAPALDHRPASQDVDAAIREALAALHDVDRDVFLLREVGGLSYEEIARATDLTPDAVRSRIHRARLDLRDRLSAPIQARRLQPMRQADRAR